MEQAGSVVHDLHELWTKSVGPTQFPHHEHVGLTANGATALATELARHLLEPGEDANAVVGALLARANRRAEGSQDGRAVQLTFADQLEFFGTHLVEPILLAIVSGDRRVKSLKRVDARGAKPVLAAEATTLFEGGARLVAVDPHHTMRAGLFTHASAHAPAPAPAPASASAASPDRARARRMRVVRPSRAAAIMAEVDKALTLLPP